MIDTARIRAAIIILEKNGRLDLSRAVWDLSDAYRACWDLNTSDTAPLHNAEPTKPARCPATANIDDYKCQLLDGHTALHEHTDITTGRRYHWDNDGIYTSVTQLPRTHHDPATTPEPPQ